MLIFSRHFWVNSTITRHLGLFASKYNCSYTVYKCHVGNWVTLYVIRISWVKKGQDRKSKLQYCQQNPVNSRAKRYSKYYQLKQPSKCTSLTPESSPSSNQRQRFVRSNNSSSERVRQKEKTIFRVHWYMCNANLMTWKPPVTISLQTNTEQKSKKQFLPHFLCQSYRTNTFENSVKF